MRHLKIFILIVLLLTIAFSFYIGPHVIATESPKPPSDCEGGSTQSVPKDPNPLAPPPCNCPPTIPFAFDDASTPDEIDPGSGITVFVTGGCPPYTWDNPGNGYTWASGTTTWGTSNTLTCAPNTGGG